jgi:hypothetical protein
MFISGTILPHSSQNVISITQFAGNQRGIRNISAQVGSSETTCVTTFPKSVCQWLAGVIDGDGCFLVSKKGYTSLEITMGLEDLPCLRYIQNKFGGNLKIRAGMKAYRYRLHNKEGMIKLVNAVNGYILNSKRLPQLHNVCTKLNIVIKNPELPTKSSHWFAGFFDADGHIDFSLNEGKPKLKIVVANKYLQDLIYYQNIFGGKIKINNFFDGIYSWEIKNREDILIMLDYFKSVTFRSAKSKRFFLIKDFFFLKDLQAFKVDNIQHKAWIEFTKKWNRLTIS